MIYKVSSTIYKYCWAFHQCRKKAALVSGFPLQSFFSPHKASRKKRISTSIPNAEKANTQKNTLLQFAQANAQTKNCKRVFFSPSQIKLKNKKFPTASKKIKLHSTAPLPTSTGIAINVNRIEQNVCGLHTFVLQMESRVCV